MYIILDLGPEEALFIPRNEIPKAQQNTNLPDNNIQLDQPTDHPNDFQKYRVRRNIDYALIQDIEE